jgi:hypothetical protein
MYIKTAKIFIFLSAFFFLAHAFTAHTHTKEENVFFVHQHNDIEDYFACLFSIDLGENHLEQCSAQEFEYDSFDVVFSDFIPFFFQSELSFFYLTPTLSDEKNIFFDKSSRLTLTCFENIKGRAPPLA